jgi:hypothetical protein
MVELIARRCRAVVCFGEAGPLMARAVEPTGVLSTGTMLSERSKWRLSELSRGT